MKAAPFFVISMALLSAPLAAQDSAQATETIRLAADAPPACIVSRGSAQSGATNAVFTPDDSGGRVAITQLVDPDTAEPRAAGIELTLPVVCNAAHRMVVASTDGGLLRAGGQAANKLAPDAFGDMMPYRIGVDWGGTTFNGASDGGNAIETAQPARHGDLRLRIATDAGGGLLTAGTYTDSITIRFEPAS